MPEAAFNRAKREAAAKEKADKAKADNDKYLSRGQKLKGEVSKFQERRVKQLADAEQQKKDMAELLKM